MSFFIYILYIFQEAAAHAAEEEVQHAQEAQIVSRTNAVCLFVMNIFEDVEAKWNQSTL